VRLLGFERLLTGMLDRVKETISESLNVCQLVLESMIFTPLGGFAAFVRYQLNPFED
jgi:hypothetical protein